MNWLYIGGGAVAGYFVLPMVWDSENSAMYGAAAGAAIGWFAGGSSGASMVAGPFGGRDF